VNDFLGGVVGRLLPAIKHFAAFCKEKSRRSRLRRTQARRYYVPATTSRTKEKLKYIGQSRQIRSNSSPTTIKGNGRVKKVAANKTPLAAYHEEEKNM
jgi:hypothetical protein